MLFRSSCLGLGIVEETCFRDDIHFYTVRWVDQDGHVSHPSETYLRAYDDRVRHSGAPPHVGWWLAAYSKHPDTWRWWDGENWSAPAFTGYSAKQAGIAANTGHDLGLGKTIVWCHYYPENARVPRVNPGVKV